MDALTVQWGWIGGYTIGGPTPPAPTPTDDGDAVALPGLPPGMLVSTTALRRRAIDSGNPWAQLLAWLRRLRRIDDEWEVSQVAIAMARAAAADETDIMEITQLTRRRH